ncbi:MAG: Omp28-related outer membrane protein, partial [Bacteroidales bacterium]|nr:Omp28-related outer membrane protein [Bacteroidales bacterium]
MKKNKIYWIFAAFLIAFIWSACDKIDEPLSLVDEQDINLDQLPFDSVVVNYKQVLLEDFTGHKCVNCPEAAINAHLLAEEKDHKLIIYSVHAGFYAEPDETGHYTADFRCETGNEIFNNFVITGWPAGTVNRVEFSGSVILGGGAWEDAVHSELHKENVINMTLKNYYNIEGNKLTVEVSSTFLQQLEGKFNLVVLIVEDHILSWQRNNEPSIGPTPDWENYEQRNVLRDAISSAFGNHFTESEDGMIVSGETYTERFSYELNEEWVTENCNVIAYIIHEETGEILQTVELGVKAE